MTMITPSYLGETIEYSSLHACRSTLEDPTASGVWVVTGSQDETARVWDLATSRPLGVIAAEAPVWGATFVDDVVATLAVSDNVQLSVATWNPLTGQKLDHQTVEYKWSKTHVAFSPDGRSIVYEMSTLARGRWDGASRYLAVDFPTERKHIEGLCFVGVRAEGEFAISSEKGLESMAVAAPGDPVTPIARDEHGGLLAASADGRWLLQGIEQRIRMFSLERDWSRGGFMETNVAVKVLALSRDGVRALVASENTVVLFFRDDGLELHQKAFVPLPQGDTATALAFEPSGNAFLVGTEKGSVRRYSIELR